MRTFVLMVLWVFLFIPACGQNSCENLYAKAVKFQQTMTIASQKQAIMYFQKAKACYDSDTKKKLCTSQIATCRNTIALIRKNKSGGNELSENRTPNIKDSLNAVNNSGKKKTGDKKVHLSVNETVLKFKAKGGEFKKVKVSCNYADWKVTEYPDWITFSINKENEIIIEAAKNKLKEERSGIIIIECRGEVVSFAVLQSKKGLFNSIGL